jgi:replicative DNA helicase
MAKQVQNTMDNIPPSDNTIEMMVLGAMILERNGLIAGITEIPSSDIFYYEAHICVFNAIKSLFDGGKPVDMVTVTNELRSTDKLKLIGGSIYIVDLTSKVNYSDNILYHISILKEMWIKRLIIRTSQENMKLAYSSLSDPFELMEKSSMEFLKLQRALSTKKANGGRSIYIDSMEEISRNMNSPGRTGMSTGIEELDNVTGGLQIPDLVIIAARPGMGKTAFALSVIRHTFAVENKAVLIFTLEMTEGQLMQRLIASESGYSASRLKKGNITIDDYKLIQNRTQSIYTDKIIIDETPGISISQLRAKAVSEKLKNPDLSLIVVDYLQLMKGDRKNGSREQEISEISSSLKMLAKELKLPILALSQLSRSVESRQDKRPQLSDLRESGAIEQDADVVIFIYRAEYYKINSYEDGSSTEGKADIIYGKNRHGACTDVTIGFNAPQMRFHSLEQSVFKSVINEIDNNFEPF